MVHDIQGPRKADEGRIFFGFEGITNSNILEFLWRFPIGLFTDKHGGDAGLHHAHIRLKATNPPSWFSWLVSKTQPGRQGGDAFVEKLGSPEVGHDFHRCPGGDGEVVAAAVFVFRERPDGIVFLRAAQASGRKVIHRPLDIDDIIIATTHPSDPPSPRPEFGEPILGDLGTHFDHDIQRFQCGRQVDHLHADLVEHHRGMHFLGAATIDQDGFFHLGRKVEKLDEKNAVLENPIFPDGLVPIPDMDGHADAKFAIRFHFICSGCL